MRTEVAGLAARSVHTFAPLLFDHGISFLSGARVIDEDAAMLTIQQGAGFPQVRGTRLITMTKGIEN